MAEKYDMTYFEEGSLTVVEVSEKYDILLDIIARCTIFLNFAGG